MRPNPPNFSILSSDATFKCGEFDVTCLAFKHLQVVKKDDDTVNPVLLGPILIHQRKLFDSHNFFFSSLRTLRPKLKDVVAFGTDGEVNLVQAMTEAFPSAEQLRCFNHMRRNIKNKLVRDIKLAPAVSEDILCDIFGRRVEDQLVAVLSTRQLNQLFKNSYCH